MYLRHTIRKKDGKVHRYWRLVRSVRVGRRVIQQTVAHLGELDEHGRLEGRALARHLIGTPEQARLFDDGSREAALDAIRDAAADPGVSLNWFDAAVLAGRAKQSEQQPAAEPTDEEPARF